MKIQMKTMSAGPDGSFQPGQIVDLPEEKAKAFVAGGYAVDVTPKAKAEAPKTEQSVETATSKPEAETAAKRTGKPRGSKHVAEADHGA